MDHRRVDGRAGVVRASALKPVQAAPRECAEEPYTWPWHGDTRLGLCMQPAIEAGAYIHPKKLICMDHAKAMAYTIYIYSIMKRAVPHPWLTVINIVNLTDDDDAAVTSDLVKLHQPAAC